MSFAKIFPFGVDSYQIWYDNAPNKKTVLTEAEYLYSDYSEEVSEQILLLAKEEGLSVLDVIEKYPVVFAIIDDVVYGLKINSDWKVIQKEKLPYNWNVT